MPERIEIKTKLPRYDLQSLARDFAMQGLSVEDTLNCLCDGLLVAHRNTPLFLRTFDRLPASHWQKFIDEDFRDWVNEGTLRENLVKYLNNEEINLFWDLSSALAHGEDIDAALLDQIPEELFSENYPRRAMQTLVAAPADKVVTSAENVETDKTIIQDELSRIAEFLRDRSYELEIEIAELRAHVFAEDLNTFLAAINGESSADRAARAAYQVNEPLSQSAKPATGDTHIASADAGSSAPPITALEERAIEEAKKIVDDFLKKYPEAQPNESEWKELIRIMLGRKQSKLKQEHFEFFFWNGAWGDERRMNRGKGRRNQAVAASTERCVREYTTPQPKPGSSTQTTL